MLQAIRPHAAGWYATQDPWSSCYGLPLRLATTAKRLDLSPAWLYWAGTAPALELVERIGVAAVHRYDLALAARLCDGLDLPVPDTALVTLERPDAAARLARAGVRASVRAGRVRLSCHLPATDADIDLAAAALDG